MPWAIEWRRTLWGAASVAKPVELAGYTTMLFATRDAARAYIKEHFGYIAGRSDLRAPPFNWRMPKAVRVTVKIEKIP